MPTKNGASSAPLEYKIIYSKRKTIELRFDGANLLLIKVPQRTRKSAIEAILHQKADWIERTRKRLAQRLPVPQMVQGEQILLLGNWHSLNIQKVVTPDEVFNTPGVITLSQKLASQGVAGLIPLYRQVTRQWTEHYAQIYSEKHQLPYNGIRVSAAKTRWGSCGANNTLNFSWRLAMTPLLSIEYVVAHELAHIKHRNHSKAFWGFVAQIMPNYEQGRAWLKQNGHALPMF